MAQSLIVFAAYLLMAVGLLGIIIPILPGVLFIWLGITVYVWQLGFTAVSLPLYLFLTAVSLITGTCDLWLPYFGARRSGAAKRTFIFGMIGAIIGSFFLPLVGTLIGYFMGVIVGEYHKRRDWDAALKAGIGSLKGWGIATLIQLVGGIIVLIIFTSRVIAFNN